MSQLTLPQSINWDMLCIKRYLRYLLYGHFFFVYKKNYIMQAVNLNDFLREAAQKRFFFSGPSTKMGGGGR